MKKRYYIIISLSLLSILAFLFDKNIINFITNNRIFQLNNFFILISNDIVVVILLLILPILLLKKKKLIITILVSFFSALILSILLKELITRPRPDTLALVKETTYSLPSNHTMISFSILPILFKENKGYPLLIIAILISFSRLYLGVHYLSDILISSALALIIGYTALKKI